MTVSAPEFRRDVQGLRAVAIRQINDDLGAVRSAEIALAKSIRGVSVFDPRPVFCNETTCSPVVNGHMGYLDPDHLNGIGSAALAPGLKAAMKEALEHRP